jgi:myosin-crossreactive antigen
MWYRTFCVISTVMWYILCNQWVLSCNQQNQCKQNYFGNSTSFSGKCIIWQYWLHKMYHMTVLITQNVSHDSTDYTKCITWPYWLHHAVVGDYILRPFYFQISNKICITHYYHLILLQHIILEQWHCHLSLQQI